MDCCVCVFCIFKHDFFHQYFPFYACNSIWNVYQSINFIAFIRVIYSNIVCQFLIHENINFIAISLDKFGWNSSNKRQADRNPFCRFCMHLSIVIVKGVCDSISRVIRDIHLALIPLFPQRYRWFQISWIIANLTLTQMVIFAVFLIRSRLAIAWNIDRLDACYCYYCPLCVCVFLLILLSLLA